MTSSEMTTTYDAVVFDLDGTLVRLDVEWDHVATDVATALSDRGIEPPSSLWEMLELADRSGHLQPIEDIISTYEREGARRSDRLPAADAVPHGPVGICSLNAESACRCAVAEHDLTDQIDVIVGRDTVSTAKPDPEPLLEAIDRLGVDPRKVIFVGDGERDERTADRAGVDFSYVDAFLRA